MEKEKKIKASELHAMLAFAMSHALSEGDSSQRAGLMGVCLDVPSPDDPLSKLADHEYQAARRVHGCNGYGYAKVDSKIDFVTIGARSEGTIPWRVFLPIQSVEMLLSVLKPFTKAKKSEVVAVLKLHDQHDGKTWQAALDLDGLQHAVVAMKIVRSKPAEEVSDTHGTIIAGLPTCLDRITVDNAPQNDNDQVAPRTAAICAGVLERSCKAFRLLKKGLNPGSRVPAVRLSVPEAGSMVTCLSDESSVMHATVVGGLITVMGVR